MNIFSSQNSLKKEFYHLWKKFTIFFVFIFFFGFLFANAYISEIKSGEIKETSLINDNPNDFSNAFFIIIYILFITALILFLSRKFSLRWLIVLLEIFLLFISVFLLLSLFIGASAFYFAFLFVLLRRILPENTLLKNIGAMASISVVGVFLGVSLGIGPMLLLLIALAIYDLIAVFKTKHMVSLAKIFKKENSAFTLTLLANLTNKLKKQNPLPKKTFELGSGDLVIPLAFSVSLLKNNLPNKAFLIPVFAYIGISLTIWFALKYKKPLPALPLQTLLMLLAFLL